MGMNYLRYLIDARPYPERASQRLRARFPGSRRLIGIASTWRPRHGLNRTASGRVGDPSKTVMGFAALNRSHARSISGRGGVSVFVWPGDPPPLKWSDLRYVFDIKED